MAAIIVLTEDYYFLIRSFFQNYLIPVFAVFTFIPLVGFCFKSDKKGQKDKSCAF